MKRRSFLQRLGVASVGAVCVPSVVAQEPKEEIPKESEMTDLDKQKFLEKLKNYKLPKSGVKVSDLIDIELI